MITITENLQKKQINSVLRLTKILIKKYRIKPNFILGHSDISPVRKKDPGEKFPWRYLSKNKISYWHNLNKKILSKNRNKKVHNSDKNIFIKNLYKIGYSKGFEKGNINYIKFLTIAFQRRFRQELVNGIVDQECLDISNNLLKYINKFS